MTDYPNITFLDVNQDVGPMKTGWFGPIRDVHLEQPGGSAEQSLTIASGSVTPAAQASRAIKLAGEGAADDILDNISLTNIPVGAIVVLRANGTDTITLNHGAGGSGQLLLRDSVDYLLDDTAKRIALQVIGTDLEEVWRSHPKRPEPDAETATTSGTTSDKTGISPNAKRITVFLKQLSLDGTTDDILLQLGDSGGLETSGYQGSTNTGAFSSGFIVAFIAAAGDLTTGVFTLDHVGSDEWVISGGSSKDTGGSVPTFGYGRKQLTGGPLDRLRLLTASGTDAFDNGSWQIRVEE